LGHALASCLPSGEDGFTGAWWNKRASHRGEMINRARLRSPATLMLAQGMTMAQIERAAIEAALRETRGNRRKAAEILDIGERTLYRKLRDYGIAPEEVGASG